MKIEKKRIAFLINTLKPGGAERTVSNLSLELADRYDIDILLNNDLQIAFPHGGRIISLGMPAYSGQMSTSYQLRALFRRIKKLNALKKERHYAAVLSFSELTNLTNVLTKNKSCRSIISCRNAVRKSNEKGWKYRLMSALCLPYCLKHADLTVSCSAEIADELMTHFGLQKEHSRVILNGVDPDKIHKMAEETLPEEDASWMADGMQVISVGRLTQQKGHLHLIRAVKRLRADGINIKLTIVGEGELRGQLEKLIRDTGSENCIRLAGTRKNPFSLMARAEAVVFPSLYEGFSNAIAEALACGVPCISTDHTSGAREILAPGSDYSKKVTDCIEYAPYGVLVPVPDGADHEANDPLTPEENLMAEAIREVLRNSLLASRYRETALQRAASLDIRSIAGQWLNLIEKGRVKA